MILIRGGRVIDPKTGTDELLDILIDGNKILEIGESLKSDGYEHVIEAAGLVVAPGLIDVHVHFRDPGFTYKEDIFSGAAAAARGGFTTVICMANTCPPVDTAKTLRYVLDKGKQAPINIFSVATVTKGMAGQELTEMEELAQSGAVGFSDDGIPLMDEVLLFHAMKKAARLGLPLSLHEEDRRLIMDNGIHQGAVSRKLGLGGAPAVAEDVLVARDCMLALHSGATVDIQHISSKNSVKMVGFAKQLGAQVFAEATPHHYSLDEEAVLKHGTLAKMNPPLRTREDREAILEGLRDGTIEIIATDHAPHSAEEKAKPFIQAPSGIIGLETSLALGMTHLVRTECLTLMQLIEKMTLNPAKLYHLSKGSIEKGGDADLTLFDPREKWLVQDFRSKACNSPFVGETLYGKVKMTVCGGKIVYRHEKSE